MKVGFFDSGLGGITVLSKFLEINKNIDIVYLADTLNAPYGEKSEDELKIIINNNINFLLKLGCDHIVVACNSASFFAQDTFNCTEMVLPIAEFCRAYNYKNNLLFATNATVNSNIYKKAFESNGICIDQYPLPLLASMIDGDYPKKDVEKYIKSELQICKNLYGGFKKYDSVILGCTHYPIVQNLFKKYLLDIKILNPANPVSEHVSNKIKDEGSKISEIYLTKKDGFVSEYIKENLKDRELFFKLV